MSETYVIDKQTAWMRAQARRSRAEERRLKQEQLAQLQHAQREMDKTRAIDAWSYAVAHYRYSRKLRKQRGAHLVSVFQTVWVVVVIPLLAWVVARKSTTTQEMVHSCICICLITLLMHCKVFRYFVRVMLDEPDQCQRHRQLANAYKWACGQALRLMSGRATSEGRYFAAQKTIAGRQPFVEPVEGALWNECLRHGQREAQARIGIQ